MQHSSRKNPCPVCGRNTDDKCRKNSTRIFCYAGDSFSPPANLRLGDRIKIEGEHWRLLSYNAGFSQNSYVFALDQGVDYRFLNLEDKREFRRKCISYTREFLEQEKTIDKLTSVLQGEEVFHEMTLGAFYKNKANAKSALELLSPLLVFASANKRYLLASQVDIDGAKKKFRETRELLAAIYSFEKFAFDSASPEK